MAQRAADWYVVFQVLTHCSLIDGYRHFGGTYCLYLQGAIEPFFVRKHGGKND
jgi:hypothetical protein